MDGWMDELMDSLMEEVCINTNNLRDGWMDRYM